MGFEFNMSRSLIVDAYKQGMTVSAFLERLDPTSRYPEHDRGLDAFQRQLARYDIRTASDPVSGMPCHTVDRFYQTDELGSKEERAALFPEWISREYRRYARVTPRRGQAVGSWNGNSRQFVTDGVRFPLGDAPLSWTLYPPAIDEMLRYQQLIPTALNLLVARTRFINSETFTALYLDDSTAPGQARMPRVSEFAELPTVRFTSGEQSIKVYKYGRRIQVSYEQIRRQTIDMLSWAIQYVAAQADVDKEATAVDVIINGDGNTGTSATSTNGSTLDSGAGGKLTLRMWVAWQMLWNRPYGCNITIGTKTALVDLLLLQAGSANLAAGSVTGSNIPQAMNVTLARNTMNGVAAIDNTAAAANTLVGLDGNWTLEMAQEVGADIVQTDQIISAQYNEIAISETLGFDIATKGQNRVLAYTA